MIRKTARKFKKNNLKVPTRQILLLEKYLVCSYRSNICGKLYTVTINENENKNTFHS